MKRFMVNAELCTECGRCIMACSLAKAGRIIPHEARISIIRNWPEVPEIAVCRFGSCPDQPCISACPFDAITKQGNLISISSELCRGCRKCIPACPYSAIQMQGEGSTAVAVKCDLCGGDPACVKECVTDALSFQEVQ